MILESKGGKYAVCRIPGMIRTRNNTLLAYYECRDDERSDWGDISVKIMRSTDLGGSFEEILTLTDAKNTLNNPVMIADGDTIHLLFCKNYKRVYHAISLDDGKSFSKPRDVTDSFRGVPFDFTVAAVGPGHGIAHRGRLLIPVWFAYNPENERAHFPSFIATFYSEDGGESWHVGELIGKDVLINPSECALASLDDGRVMISIRNENAERMRAIAFSDTGIGGWSQPYFEKNLADPVCQGSMDTRGGAVYHINCAAKDGRNMLTVKRSSDAFATVESILVDELGGYSDLVVTDSGVFVIYERDIWQEGTINFKKL